MSGYEIVFTVANILLFVDLVLHSKLDGMKNLQFSFMESTLSFC